MWNQLSDGVLVVELLQSNLSYVFCLKIKVKIGQRTLVLGGVACTQVIVLLETGGIDGGLSHACSYLWDARYILNVAPQAPRGKTISASGGAEHRSNPPWVGIS